MQRLVLAMTVVIAAAFIMTSEVVLAQPTASFQAQAAVTSGALTLSDQQLQTSPCTVDNLSIDGDTVNYGVHCSTQMMGIRFTIDGHTTESLPFPQGYMPEPNIASNVSVFGYFGVGYLDRGSHTLTIEVAPAGDDNWTQAASRSLSYTTQGSEVLPSSTDAAARLGLTNGDLVRSDDPNNFEIDIIQAGQRRHVPNPDTLTAITSRYGRGVKTIAAADFGSIPTGADIPDVDRDPNGFQQSMIDIYGQWKQPASAPTPTSTPHPQATQTPVPQEGPAAQWAQRLAAISQLYREELGREADNEGLYGYANSNLTIDQIRQDLMNSAEYQRLHQPQASFQFVLGFKLLADQIPDIVGQPLENEHPSVNGDVQQRTTNGLLVWRKADNWTAFTNGSRTWINGPYGIQDRDNNDRFDWEKDQQKPVAAPASGSSPTTGGEALPRTGPPEEQLPVTGSQQGAGGNRLAVDFIRQYNGQTISVNGNSIATQNYDCGPASVAMVVQFYGRRPSGVSDAGFLSEVRRATGNLSASDTTFGQLEAALGAYNLRYSEVSSSLSPAPDAQMQSMKNAIAAGNPVIALLHGEDLGRGAVYGDHWVVVTGFSDDGQTVYLNDPDDQSKPGGWIPGGQTSLSYSRFRQANFDAQAGPYGIIVGY